MAASLGVWCCRVGRWGDAAGSTGGFVVGCVTAQTMLVRRSWRPTRRPATGPGWLSVAVGLCTGLVLAHRLASHLCDDVVGAPITLPGNAGLRGVTALHAVGSELWRFREFDQWARTNKMRFNGAECEVLCWG